MHPKMATATAIPYPNPKVFSTVVVQEQQTRQDVTDLKDAVAGGRGNVFLVPRAALDHENFFFQKSYQMVYIFQRPPN